ncbi:caspase family protein [Acuticoccus sediminis]|uniref:caspase family protein n=1 Tax=Acuticoccus sediminis TaxID=2184697 RepID=UPI001CFD9162|nr:caspase family protein [Acuticoccus sediminis]
MRQLVRLFTAIIAAATVIATVPAEAYTERRVALVIGNGAYQHAPSLKNPVADARAMADKLRELGFTVVEGYDVDFAQMNRTLLSFAREVGEADLSVFFYAGHGVAHAGSNYLIPIDAKFRDASYLDLEAVRADLITNQMQYSDGVNIVFLDACRDNPLNDPKALSSTSTRSIATGRGLANMSAATAGKGIAIAFATSPGQVAQDGSGEHSPFTTALLRHIGTPDLDITSAMSLVTGDVLEMTREQQRPWLNTSLTGRVFLHPAADPAPATSPTFETAAVAPSVPPILTPRPAATEASLEPAPSTTGGADRSVPSGVGGVTARATSTPPASPPPAVQDTRTVSLEAQELLWKYAEKSGRVADYNNYLITFPNGLFAPLAKSRIGELERQVAATTPPSVPPVGLGPSIGAAPSLAAPAAPPTFETGPLTLKVTAAVKASPATAETEQALLMDREKAREVQHRLNLAGYDVGYPDGLFGPKTRGGIAGFQEAKALPATGYLNALQLEILTVDTADELEEKPLPELRTVTRTPPPAATSSRATQTRSVSRSASTPKRTTSTKRTATSRSSSSTRRTTTARTTEPRPPRVVSRRPVHQETISPGAAAFAGAVVGGVVGGLLAR